MVMGWPCRTLLCLCPVAAAVGTTGGRKGSPRLLQGFSNSTEAIWAPAASRGAAVPPSFVLLRPPTFALQASPARMVVLVSAAPDPINQGQLLGMYKLYINGVLVGMGPGRGQLNQHSHPFASVYDVIEVPAVALLQRQRQQDDEEGVERGSGSNATTSISVALQCLNLNSSRSAWAMLEAEIYDAEGGVLARVQTSSRDWVAYDADAIFRPGQLDTGSGKVYVNEDIDAQALAPVARWRSPEFDPVRVPPRTSRPDPAPPPCLSRACPLPS
jgi:hypothetical protein